MNNSYLQNRNKKIFQEKIRKFYLKFKILEIKYNKFKKTLNKANLTINLYQKKCIKVKIFVRNLKKFKTKINYFQNKQIRKYIKNVHKYKFLYQVKLLINIQNRTVKSNLK